MFKDLKKGTTHYENDHCGVKAHNKEIEKEFAPVVKALEENDMKDEKCNCEVYNGELIERFCDVHSKDTNEWEKEFKNKFLATIRLWRPYFYSELDITTKDTDALVEDLIPIVAQLLSEQEKKKIKVFECLHCGEERDPFWCVDCVNETLLLEKTEEQKRILGIIDESDAICNVCKSGLLTALNTKG